MAVRVRPGTRQAVRQERAQSSSSPSLARISQFVAILAVVLGLVAFPIAGFANLGSLQAIPVYAYFALLLLELQALYWQTRLTSPGATGLRYVLRTLLFSIPAIVFVAILAFTPIKVAPLLNNPAIYIVANAVLFILFAFDAYGRWHQRAA